MGSHLFAFVIVSQLMSFSFAHADGEIVYIESMSNATQVSITGLQATEKVKPGQILDPGSSVQTKDSSARIIFQDGSAITIGKNSELQIKQPESDAKTKKPILVSFLKNGFLHARIHHQEDPTAAQHFYIETTAAVAGVRGTEFTMSMTDQKEFQMHVLEGKVAVAADRSKIEQAPVISSGEMVGSKAGLIEHSSQFNLADYRKHISASHAEVHKLIYNQIKTHNEASVIKPMRRRRR